MIEPSHIELRSSHPAIAKGWDWHVASDEWSALIWCDAATGRARAVRRDGTSLGTWTNPLDALAWLDQSNLTTPDMRWIGYLSYDLGRWFETLPARATDDLNLPLFLFVLGPNSPSPHPPTTPTTHATTPATSNFSRPAYLAAVQRSIDYIAAGDVFQVNLSQRFTTPTTRSSAEITQRLRDNGGAWYGASLHFSDFAILSNSPELFLSVTPLPTGGRLVTTRPIKGTRPRGPGMRDELLASEKDQAELNMIVDLERNDLGRVCQIGSVKVTEPRTIEEHPTVYHGAATVQGALRTDVTLVDLLRATFPGGSITGAPKIRAMQIIDELEPTRRGPYCGAIGWIGHNRQLQLNVAIRTMILKHGLAHMPVGGGIVADSTPESEYAETLVKARALFDAVGITRKPN